MRNLIRMALASLLLAAVALPAVAQQVYKCKQANGQLAYQDHPCGDGAHDAGAVSGNITAPLPNGDSAASHYQNYNNMMQQEHAQQQAERRQLEADDRQRQAEPHIMQADQRDYRSHICQAQLDTELTKHRYASFSCDADGNKVPTPRPAVVVVPEASRR